MDDDRPTRATCGHCSKRFKVDPRGRVPKFCRPACRSMAFVAKNRRGIKVTPEHRARLRMWELLKDGGLVPADAPLPPKRKPEDER